MRVPLSGKGRVWSPQGPSQALTQREAEVAPYPRAPACLLGSLVTQAALVRPRLRGVRTFQKLEMSGHSRSWKRYGAWQGQRWWGEEEERLPVGLLKEVAHFIKGLESFAKDLCFILK